MLAGQLAEDELTQPRKHPAVSAVVPCYQCRDTIARALDSVRNQHLAPMEVLLVDDGSEDGTLEALHHLAQRFSKDLRIEVLSLKRNRGPATARNAGWDAARGEYVAFLDADATWHPRKLEIQYRFMERHPDVYLSGHLRAVSSGRMDERLVNDKPIVRYLGFDHLLWTNPVAPSAIMVRNDRRFRFREGQRRMEDHRLLLDMARAGERLALLKLRLAAHHKPDFGAGGLSANLLAMERAELGNYQELYRLRAIGAPLLIALCAWSVVKFSRRLAIVGLRNFHLPR